MEENKGGKITSELAFVKKKEESATIGELFERWSRAQNGEGLETEETEEKERTRLDYAKHSWNDIVQFAIAHSDLYDFYFVVLGTQGSGRGPARGEHAHRRGRRSGCDICRKVKNSATQNR